MSFTFSETQSEIQATLRRCLNDLLPPGERRLALERVGASEQRSALEPLGLHSYILSDDASPLHDLAIAAFESGRSLVSFPLVEGLLAAALVKGMPLPEGARLTVAPQLAVSSLTLVGSAATGSLMLTPGDGTETHVLVGAHDGGAWLIELDGTTGISAPVPSLDLTAPRRTITVSGAPAVPVPEVSAGQLALAEEILRAVEIAGCCSRAVEMTVEYVKHREQYGAPVGSFQAVQHRLAEMHVHAESLRAVSLFAAWAFDRSVSQRELAGRAAAREAYGEGPKCVEGAIQLHGGIGFTWEFDLHLYLRRVKCLEAIYGGTDNLGNAKPLAQLVGN